MARGLGLLEPTAPLPSRSFCDLNSGRPEGTSENSPTLQRWVGTWRGISPEETADIHSQR